MEEKAKKIAELLKLLANEQRLLILCALMHGRKNVSEIHGHTPNITASALSQHLNPSKSSTARRRLYENSCQQTKMPAESCVPIY